MRAWRSHLQLRFLPLSLWQLSGERAVLSIGELQALVEPSRPFEGLQQVQWLGQPFRAGRLLAVRTDMTQPGEPEAVAEAYVRGTDLVATYVQAPPRTVRPQIYWRAVDLGTPREPLTGCELIVSMQTSLLDSDPGLFAESELAAGEVLRMTDADAEEPDWQPVSLASGRASGGPQDGEGVLLLRFAGTEWSYAEMIHPADFLGYQIEQVASPAGETGRTVRLRYRLFGERLEKGVIRRVRVRGMFVPRRRDQEAAAECYRDLIQERLPLTT